MSYFQKNGVVYWLDADAPVSLLPAGAEPITDAQAHDLLPKPTARDLILADIASKLGKVGLTQSWQLEGFMAGTLSLGLAEGYTEAQMYALNPGYRDAKDLLAEVRALEAQL